MAGIPDRIGTDKVHPTICADFWSADSPRIQAELEGSLLHKPGVSFAGLPAGGLEEHGKSRYPWDPHRVPGEEPLRGSLSSQGK